MVLRDVNNIVARMKRDRRGQGSDEERTVSLLRAFCASPGNSAAISVDDESGLVHAVCFQNSGMKRLFDAFPEVALVDTTHGTNRNHYKLFSLLVDDVFGKVRGFLYIEWFVIPF